MASYLGISKDIKNLGKIFNSSSRPSKTRFPMYRSVVGPFSDLRDLAKYATMKGIHIVNPVHDKARKESQTSFGTPSRASLIKKIKQLLDMGMSDIAIENYLYNRYGINSAEAHNWIAKAYDTRRRKKNPGAKWHYHEEVRARDSERKANEKKQKLNEAYYMGVADAHKYSQEVSRRLGVNPKKKRKAPKAFFEALRAKYPRKKKKSFGSGRGMNLNAVLGAIRSPKTPQALKDGLIRKYGKQLGI